MSMGSAFLEALVVFVWAQKQLLMIRNDGVTGSAKTVFVIRAHYDSSAFIYDQSAFIVYHDQSAS